MKHLKFSCVSLLTAAALIFTSCSDNDEPNPVSSPVVDIKIKNTDSKIKKGDTITATVTVTDKRVDLKNWEASVVPALEEKDETKLKNNDAAWKEALKNTENKIKGNFENGKKSGEAEIKIIVPNDDKILLGKYNLKVVVYNKAGNKAGKLAEVNLIDNESVPTPPDTGGENTGGENTGGENTGGENTGGEPEVKIPEVKIPEVKIPEVKIPEEMQFSYLQLSK